MNKLLNEGGVYCVVAGDMRDLLLPIKNGKNKTSMSFSVFCNFREKVACHCSIANLIAWTIIPKGGIQIIKMEIFNGICH